MSEPDVPSRQLERIRQVRGVDVAITGIAAWRPWPLGRDGTSFTPGNVVSDRYYVRISRYRLLPSPAQEEVLRDHCAHARYVWNLAVEQNSHWHPGRTSAPGYLEQCRQLTRARAEHEWLREGSQMVQQQALRDFAQAMAAFFDPENPAGRPS